MQEYTYYKIGISGHRDLLPAQKEENLVILKGHLLKVQREQQNRPLLILTPLAEGADRLIAQVALELGIPYDVILPMPLKLYCNDFSPASKKEFMHYLKYARTIETIPLYAGNTHELIATYSTFRNFQYRQVGRTIVEKTQEMIIMSDGTDNQQMGGTADIMNYAKTHGKILYNIKCDRLCA